MKAPFLFIGCPIKDFFFFGRLGQWIGLGLKKSAGAARAAAVPPHEGEDRRVFPVIVRREAVVHPQRQAGGVRPNSSSPANRCCRPARPAIVRPLNRSYAW